MSGACSPTSGPDPLDTASESRGDSHEPLHAPPPLLARMVEEGLLGHVVGGDLPTVRRRGGAAGRRCDSSRRTRRADSCLPAKTPSRRRSSHGAPGRAWKRPSRWYCAPRGFLGSSMLVWTYRIKGDCVHPVNASGSRPPTEP